MHGSLFSGLRNELLNANNWFANQHGDGRAFLRLQDFAATLGGPLRRNRTFFFLSYEGMRLSQPFVWRQPVPTLAAREEASSWVQPVLNLFPAPNGPGLGSGLAQWTAGISRPSRLDTGGARLDHVISSRLTAFARYSDSPSSTEFGSSQVNLLDVRSKGVTLGLNWRARPDLLFDLRFNDSTATATSRWDTAGSPALPVCFQLVGASNSCDSLERLSIAGVGQVVSGPEGRRSQSQYEVNQTGAWNRGSHSIQFGASYVRLAPVRRDAAGAVNVLANNLNELADTNTVWFPCRKRLGRDERGRSFRRRHLARHTAANGHLWVALGDQSGSAIEPARQFCGSTGNSRAIAATHLAVNLREPGAPPGPRLPPYQSRADGNTSRRWILL